MWPNLAIKAQIVVGESSKSYRQSDTSRNNNWNAIKPYQALSYLRVLVHNRLSTTRTFMSIGSHSFTCHLTKALAVTPAIAYTRFIYSFKDKRSSWPVPVSANMLLKDITWWTESSGMNPNSGGFVLVIMSQARYTYATAIRLRRVLLINVIHTDIMSAVIK